MNARSLTIGVGVLAGSAWLAGCGAPVDHVETFDVDGEPVRLELRMATRADVDTAVVQAHETMSATRAALALDRDGSRLDEINAAAADDWATIDDRDVYRCVLLALDWAWASHGAFDPTIGPVTLAWRAIGGPPEPGALAAPLAVVGWDRVTVAEEARAVHFRDPGMLLDLGGIAGGFTLDIASRVFSRPGSLGGLLRYGDEALAWGEGPSAGDWLVSLDDPRSPGRALLTLRTTNRALSVSGDCADHCVGVPTLDPATGLPPDHGVVVAVAVADSGGDAEALSTALYVAGPQRGGDLLQRARRVEAVLVVEEPGERRSLLASASLEGRLTLSAELREEVGDRVRFLLPPKAL